MDRDLMIYRDEYGTLRVSPADVHVCGGDILVFRASGVEAKVEINQPRIGWRVDIVVFPNNPKGVQVSVPAYPMGVYNYSIACTATGNVARGLSDPKIIIDK